MALGFQEALLRVHQPAHGGAQEWTRPLTGAFFETLARHGTTEPFRNRMFDFRQVNELVGTPEMLETGRRIAEDRFETPQK